ncbi:monovalent cation/H+ antiporter subunit D family protein [Thalassobaculum sp.]|uniref:monovalent cation/H+ antiporter subunit D family protein n=1 Tax=Thalassobaculum sp. TaxID=2022740 RepID=UPI0032EE5BF4
MTGPTLSGIIPHLPALQVVVPLLAAPICFLLRRGSVCWGFATLVSWAAFAMSLMLLEAVLTDGTIRYAMGGWIAPWGIEYVVDATNAIVLVIVSGIGAAVMPYARRSVMAEIPASQHGLYYTAYLLCLAGLLGVTITGDAFNVFVFLEITSLSSYILVSAGAGMDRRALTAAYNYLVLGTVGATFFVIGVGLLYMVTGTLNIIDLSERVPALQDNRTVHVAFAFIVVGMGLKLALFPLHTWLPNAYTYAPSTGTAFLAATSTKVSVYVLLRFLFVVFAPSYGFMALTLDYVLLPLALIAMVAATIAAIYQYNIKRLLAYSSVAQLGYMVLGIAYGSVEGLTAAILHLFNHALMKGALFLALGCIMLRVGDVTMRGVQGLGRQMPWTMAAFVTGGLSLIGVPLTVGFISKWYLITAALDDGRWPIAVVILASSLLAIIYVWKIVEAAYLKEPPAGRVVREAPLSMLVPTWVLVLANIGFGISAEYTVGVARTAAIGLLGGTP